MAKILIVDDAAFMRMMIKDILTKNGYEVVAEAANVEVRIALNISWVTAGTEAIILIPVNDTMEFI